MIQTTNSKIFFEAHRMSPTIGFAFTKLPMKASTRDNKLLTLTMRQQKESNKVIGRLETIATSRAGIFTVKTQRHICPDSFESESKAIWIRFECSKFDKLRFYDCDYYWWAQWKFNRSRKVLSTVWSFVAAFLLHLLSKLIQSVFDSLKWASVGH